MEAELKRMRRAGGNVIPTCVLFKQKYLLLIQDIAGFIVKHQVFFDPIRVNLKRILLNAIFATGKIVDKWHSCRYMDVYYDLIVTVEKFLDIYEFDFEPLRSELKPILNSVPTGKRYVMYHDKVTKLSVPVFEMNPDLSFKLFSNSVVIQEIVSFLDKDNIVSARQIGRNWNDAIMSNVSTRDYLKAYCATKLDKKDYRPADKEIPCDCDFNLMDLNMKNAHPIQRFNLGFSWKDHLSNLAMAECVQKKHAKKYVIESLNLNPLPVLGLLVLDVPMTRDFLLRRSDSSSFYIDETMTSLPRSLEWLDGSLKTISKHLSPKRFKTLKNLDVCLTLHEFCGTTQFNDQFYDVATSCVLENEPGLDYELDCLTHFKIGTAIPAVTEFCTHYPKYTFITAVAARMIENVCQSARNLTHLDAGGCIIYEKDSHIVNPSIDKISIPKIQNLKLHGLCDGEAVASVTKMLVRSKQSATTFSLTHLQIELTGFNSGMSELLTLVAESIENLKLVCGIGFHTCKWPVMPRLTTFTTNSSALKSFSDLDFNVKMPLVRKATIVRRFFTDEGLYMHPLFPQFLNGDISTVPEGVRTALPDAKVNSSTLQSLTLEHDQSAFFRSRPCTKTAIKLNCPKVTSLTLKNMGCVVFLLDLVKKLPLLTKLDISVKCDHVCSETRDHICYVDFIFTGLPFEQVYEIENGAYTLENLSGVVPPELIPLSERRDCLLHRTSIRNLTVRHLQTQKKDRFQRVLSDWSGYHGFALMTHLETLTIESKFFEGLWDHKPGTKHVLSEGCMEFVKKALESKTQVNFVEIQL